MKRPYTPEEFSRLNKRTETDPHAGRNARYEIAGMIRDLAREIYPAKFTADTLRIRKALPIVRHEMQIASAFALARKFGWIVCSGVEVSARGARHCGLHHCWKASPKLMKGGRK